MTLIPRTGGEILVANLLAQGATHAFCVPGESYLAVLDALYDVRDRIGLYVCRHEGGAATMAEAYGKLTGRPGIALVTRGPGASNAAIGIHTAAQDSTPMIVFVGQVGGDFVDREAFQEVDYRRMYGGVAKWAAQIDRADRIPEYVAHAYRIAMSGRPGPVVLALPEDMLTSRAACADTARVE
ncbi:MAG: thiamine pyrophosphate-binding protein, partial [Aromatoleum sp.]|nr:thiamine pyrophosphate-binding protein [Aromatoleum sp.]